MFAKAVDYEEVKKAILEMVKKEGMMNMKEVFEGLEKRGFRITTYTRAYIYGVIDGMKEQGLIREKVIGRARVIIDKDFAKRD